MSDTKFDNFLSCAAGIENRKLPPVDQWNPEFCGDIDIRIARNGSWYHEGRPFLRPSLVRLLSSILKREGDDYFLVSPVEKMRIQVEDVPFIAVGMTQEEADGKQILYFRTLTDDLVRLDAEHPLRVQTDSLSGEPRPYIQVRGGMEARIHRPVFKDWVELGGEVIGKAGLYLLLGRAGRHFNLAGRKIGFWG
ncbi:MAG: DUF1285 domain-containing protein, partial [Pseudomonadales bacterium]|nr:DUF1285 domain-containing protein [Pseudomonadales bacterium]